jgi:pimeloyl-ACP methyl ester carboxylesterase
LFKKITYKSSTIFYRVTGKGKTVVLLHGFGEDGEIWNDQVEYLKDHFRLLVPDLPGSGRSEMISDMSIEGMAELVKAIMETELAISSPLGGGWVGAFGHSMGGYITLAFAEKYPQMLSAFGIIHSTAFADPEEKKLARLKSIEFIKNNGAHEFLKASTPGLFKGAHPYIDILIEKGKTFSSEALIQYYKAMIARPDRTAVLKNFNGPILFIIGEYDNAVPFQQSLQQCHMPARSQVHILRNSAHMGMLEETGKVNKILLRFLHTVQQYDF